MTWEPLEFIEAPGEHVLIPIRAGGRAASRSNSTSFGFGHCEMAIEVFRHRAEALDAAGLGE
jgi:hypothetical protein